MYRAEQSRAILPSPSPNFCRDKTLRLAFQELPKYEKLDARPCSALDVAGFLLRHPWCALGNAGRAYDADTDHRRVCVLKHGIEDGPSDGLSQRHPRALKDAEVATVRVLEAPLPIYRI